MARSIEDKLIHVPFDHGMDQSFAPRTAPVGTFNLVLNCRKRGQKGVLECRPGRSQFDSTCLGETKHYIAGDGSSTYVYRPCFVTRLDDVPLLGTTAGEAFARAQQLWTYCGRFSTCLPIEKHVTFSPTKLAPNDSTGGTIFLPQVAVSSSGYVMSVAIDSTGGLQACIDTPDGVRQAIAWTSSTTVRAVRLVALNNKFFLWWQNGSNLSVNSYIPTTSSSGVTYTEHGVMVGMVSSSYYWDVFAPTDGTGTVMCLVSQAADRVITLQTYSNAPAVTHTATLGVGAGPIPVSLWQHPTTSDYWLGFNDISGGLTGTNTSATVDTSTNKTLRYRTNKSQSYRSINVTSGAGTSKVQIAADLNADFALNSIPLSASIVGTNQIKIVNTSTDPASGVPGSLVDIDSVANGSNLNTAVGFPTAQSNTFEGPTYAIFTSILGVVLTYATIDSSKASSSFGPPLFGHSRGSTPVDSVTGRGFYAIASYVAGSLGSIVGRQLSVGTASSAGTVTAPCALACMFPVSKPDNYGRIWVMLDEPSTTFLVTRYALLRFFDTAIDSSSASNIRLLSAPTVELVTDGFPSLSAALRQDNLTTNWIGRYFTSIATASDSYMVGLWAPVEQLDGQAISGAVKTNTQHAGVLAQAQIFEYSGVELDDPIHTHRDIDAIQQTMVVSGQPVELFGAPTAEVFNGITSATTNFAYSAGASEIGFLHPPSLVSIRNSGDLSATPAAGDYLYKAVFQWVDKFGRRHQSTPSAPVSFTADGVHAVEFTAFTTQATQRQSRNTAQAVEVIIYRTVAGGTQYHETTMRATLNDTNGDRTLVFTDDLSDANISDNAFLYTDGGVLPNDIAPSCRFSCRAEERVWFGGLWDPTLIQCSKLIVPGEPIQTPESDAFRVQLLRPCTGLSYMDGQVIAFAKDAIFLVNGDGPNDQGNGSFSVRPLTLTLGCIDYRSILETEDGVLFQSSRGIYLIPRGFSPPQFVGAAIQDLMLLLSSGDAQPEILSTSYTLGNQGSYAKFLLRDSSSSTGGTIIALMDTDAGEWFLDLSVNASREMGYLTRSDTLALGPGSLYAAPTFSTASGTLSPVLYETAADRFDYPHNGSTKSAVELEVDSSYMTPFGLGGWGRFNKAVASFETDTNNMTFAIHFLTDDSAIDATSWNATDATMLNKAQYRELQLNANQGTSGKFIVTLNPVDTNVTANYTCKLIGFSAELEPSHGMRLTAPEERA